MTDPTTPSVSHTIDAILVACWKGNYGVAKSQLEAIRNHVANIEAERDAARRDAERLRGAIRMAEDRIGYWEGKSVSGYADTYGMPEDDEWIAIWNAAMSGGTDAAMHPTGMGG